MDEIDITEWYYIEYENNRGEIIQTLVHEDPESAEELDYELNKHEKALTNEDGIIFIYNCITNEISIDLAEDDDFDESIKNTLNITSIDKLVDNSFFNLYCSDPGTNKDTTADMDSYYETLSKLEKIIDEESGIFPLDTFQTKIIPITNELFSEYCKPNALDFKMVPLDKLCIASVTYQRESVQKIPGIDLILKLGDKIYTTIDQRLIVQNKDKKFRDFTTNPKAYHIVDMQNIKSVKEVFASHFDGHDMTDEDKMIKNIFDSENKVPFGQFDRTCGEALCSYYANDMVENHVILDLGDNYDQDESKGSRTGK